MMRAPAVKPHDLFSEIGIGNQMTGIRYFPMATSMAG
jgi:hypothetical protein